MPTQAEQVLIDANAIIAQALPLVNIVSIGVRATIALLRANGNHQAATDFETELNAAEAARSGLGAAINEFRKKYPIE